MLFTRCLRSTVEGEGVHATNKWTGTTANELLGEVQFISEFISFFLNLKDRLVVLWPKCIKPVLC